MYQSHWGLQKSPFRGCLDPELFFESPGHGEALARMQFLVENRRRVGLLTGIAGSGKSMLLEVLAEQYRRQGQPAAKIDLIGLEPAEMLATLAVGLELNVDPTDSMGLLWRAVTDRLTEYRFRRLNTAILLDDADRASQPVLDQITRLAQHDRSPESRVTLILAGQRQRIGRLGDTLLGLAELRIEVEPWEEPETAEFLKTSLARAGRESPVFDDSAVALLHELTHGIPRRVSQLADLSLVAGAGAGLDTIDAEVIESVYHELGMVEV
ncbi:MAG: AAA family ATPase [Candidatus Nealsonbacteria bacterium]|nr:AAA family ATPase [Candidatus Nealsonbacteria bacterium]